MQYNFFFLVMMDHNVTLDIYHDLKYRTVSFSSTLHFASSLTQSLHVATLVMLTIIKLYS
jgi:hypothetical protein